MATNDYQSFLLRMWRVQEDGHSWRVLLEEVETGKHYGFANLKDLLDFLERLNGEGEQPGKEEGLSES